MAGARFDIQFAGELLEGADREAVRRRIQAMFKLTDQAANRLFSTAEPLTIKRGVDTATASRFREVFRELGALVSVVPVGAVQTAEQPAQSQPDSTPPRQDGRLSLSPARDSRPLETPGDIPIPSIDTAHLSLVPGEEWTLEDCTPATPPVAEPDTGNLSVDAPDSEQPDGAS